MVKFPDTGMGKNKGPIPIEKPASKIQPPKVLPIVRLNSFFLTALMFTKSSGRDVPIATARKLTMYSDI